MDSGLALGISLDTSRSYVFLTIEPVHFAASVQLMSFLY